MDPDGFGDGGPGAYGGAKAGAIQDPLTFAQRPAVVIRICSLLSAIIVFGCVSSSGWFFLQHPNGKGAEVCVMNMDSSACHFSTFVGIIAFLAAIGFIMGEWFFEQMSSIKTRKHYVLFDMGFSGLWAFFYAVAFIYMANAWRQSDNMFAFAKSNIIGAIAFAFFSIFCWLGSVGMAYQRYRSGSAAAFAQGGSMEDGDDDPYPEDVGSQYQSYAEQPGGGYGEQPFQGGAQKGMGYHQY